MTWEGWAVWGTALKLGGQMRMVAGADRPVASGWDMAAVLALAAAAGVPAHVAAEMFPALEAAVVAALNDPGAALAALEDGDGADGA